MVNEEESNNSGDLVVLASSSSSSSSTLFDDGNVVGDSKSDNDGKAQVERHQTKRCDRNETNVCNDDTPLYREHHDDVFGTADHSLNGTPIMRNQNMPSKYRDGENVEKPETINGIGRRGNDDPEGECDNDCSLARMNRTHTDENRQCTVPVTNKVANVNIINGTKNSDSELTGSEVATKIDVSYSISSCDRSQNDKIEAITTATCTISKTCVQCTTPMLESGDAAAVVVCGGNNKINNSACETSTVENTEKHLINNVQCRTRTATNKTSDENNECNNKIKLPRSKVKRMQTAYINHLNTERDSRLTAEDDVATRRQNRRSPRGIAKPSISTSSSSSSISSSFTHDDEDHTTNDTTSTDHKADLTGLVVSLRCSLPLDKINTSILDSIKKKADNDEEKINGPKKRFLCLFCERIFASANLRQKHVERCHSANQSRRSSSRTPGHSQLIPSCMYCGKVDDIGNDLHKLLQHLVLEHSCKYHACVPCEERFTNRDSLETHQLEVHGIKIEEKDASNDCDEQKKRKKKKNEEPLVEDSKELETDNSLVSLNDSKDSKDSDSKIKKLKCIPRTTRTTRRTAALKSRNLRSSSEQNSATSDDTSTQKVVFDRISTTSSTTPSEASSNKMSSSSETTPVNYEFDENFFRCVAFNIRDNLLNHLDGKLNRNLDWKESNECTSSTAVVAVKNPGLSEHSGGVNVRCLENLALTALTPVTSLLTSQIGIDAYRQIEYGSKAPLEMTRTRHYVKYNFRSRKNKQNGNEYDLEKRDISKLDMWTQIAMKLRQQKVNKNGRMQLHCQTELFTGAGEISMQVEELNRILDTRGPFQDLREENQQFMTGTRALDFDPQHADNVEEVRSILEDLINSAISNVPKVSANNRVTRSRLRIEKSNTNLSVDDESLTYLNLSRIKSVEPPTPAAVTKLGLDLKQIDPYLSEADHSLIVSSSVELSGEWARPRIYICGACGVKLPSLKQLEDHKSFVHPYIWCMHYEFVGNQSEFYPHLNIPGLGRILEKEKRDRYNREHNTEEVWERSDSRVCTKCNRQCNSLGELHRHMLECGGDWAWMLAKKKCKYRPYGTRRRRQRGMKRNFVRVIDKNEQRKFREKTKTDGPRPPRPSDAETIQRMLANLPAKRATRKIMCLKDGGHRKPRQKSTVNPPTSSKKESTITSSVKAANQKLKQALQKNLRTRNQLNKNSEESSNQPKIVTISNTPRKTQKVLASKVIDSNTSTGPKSKLKKMRFTESVMKITRLRHKLLVMQNNKKVDENLTDTIKKQPNRTRIFKKIQKKLPTFRRSLRINNSTTVPENESANTVTENSVSGLKKLTRNLRKTTKKITETTAKIFKKDKNTSDSNKQVFDKRKRKINSQTKEDGGKKAKLANEASNSISNVETSTIEPDITIPVIESVGPPFDVQIDSAITLPILVSVPSSTTKTAENDSATNAVTDDSTVLLIAPENCDLSDSRILKNSNTSASANTSCETSATCVEVDVQISQDTTSTLPTSTSASTSTTTSTEPQPVESSQNTKPNPVDNDDNDPSKNPDRNLPVIIKTEPPDFPPSESSSTNACTKMSRVKKPVRKLNDCIAMLTCKLQQKLQTQPTSTSPTGSVDLNQSKEPVALTVTKPVNKSVLNVPILKVPAVNHLRYDFLQHKPTTDYVESVDDTPIDYTYSNLTKTLSLQSASSAIPYPLSTPFPPSQSKPIPLVSSSIPYNFVPQIPREEPPKSVACTVLNVPKLITNATLSSSQDIPLCLTQTKSQPIIHSTTSETPQLSNIAVTPSDKETTELELKSNATIVEAPILENETLKNIASEVKPCNGKRRRQKKNGGLAKLNQVVDQLSQKVNDSINIEPGEKLNQESEAPVKGARKTRQSHKKLPDPSEVAPVLDSGKDEVDVATIVAPQEEDPERKIGRGRSKKVITSPKKTSPRASPRKTTPKSSPKKASPRKVKSPLKTSQSTDETKVVPEAVEEILSIEIENKTDRLDNEEDMEIDVVTVELEKPEKSVEVIKENCLASVNDVEPSSVEIEDSKSETNVQPQEENTPVITSNLDEFKNIEQVPEKGNLQIDEKPPILTKPSTKTLGENRKIGRGRKKDKSQQCVENKMKNVALIIENIIRQYSVEPDEEKEKRLEEKSVDLNEAFINQENETIPTESLEKCENSEPLQSIESNVEKVTPVELIESHIINEDIKIADAVPIESMKSPEIPEAIERSEEAETPETLLEQANENVDINENNNINIETMKKFEPKPKRVFKTRKKIRRSVQKSKKSLKIFLPKTTDHVEKSVEVLPLSEKIIESENITPESASVVAQPTSSHPTTNILPLFENPENTTSSEAAAVLHENKENSNVVEQNEPILKKHGKVKAPKTQKQGPKRNLKKKIAKQLKNTSKNLEQQEEKLESIKPIENAPSEIEEENNECDAKENSDKQVEPKIDPQINQQIDAIVAKSDDSDEDEIPLAKIITKNITPKIIEEEVKNDDANLHADEPRVVESPAEIPNDAEKIEPKGKFLRRMPKIKLRRRKINKKKSKILKPRIVIPPPEEIFDALPISIEPEKIDPVDEYPKKNDAEIIEDIDMEKPSITVEKTPPHSPILIRIKTSQIKPPLAEHYCEICKKKFCRAENLAKHKMTFTHIAKLSEIEAREHALRLAESKEEEQEPPKDDTEKPVKENEEAKEETEETKETEKLLEVVKPCEVEDKNDVDNRDSDDESMEPFTLGSGVNYPDLVTSHQPKRYRSLGERKSFDSNPAMLSPTRFEDIQRTLDEEDEDEAVFHDEKSSSSIDDFRDNSPLNSPIYYSDKTIVKTPVTQRDPNLIFDYLKKSGPENTKNVVFEENQFSENFVRKTLNRDEELFLECCSLLKNNSKHRSVTSETKHVDKDAEIVDGNCPDWSNSNSIESDWLSRPDESSSNTQFSNVLLNNTSYQWLRQKESLESFDTSNDNSSFQNKSSLSHSEKQSIVDDEKEDTSIDSSSQSLSASISTTHQTSIRDYITTSTDTPSAWDETNNDSKKIPTKGALKVFEGIKVSIPTQELDLEQVLNCSSVSQSSSIGPAPSNRLKLYKNGVEVSQSILTKTKITKRTSSKKCGNKLGLREFKKRTKAIRKTHESGGTLKRKNNAIAKNLSQTKDVYDFEESQDETELVPPSKTFKMFRDKSANSTPVAENEAPALSSKNPLLKHLKSFISEDSESDQHAYLDSFSIDESSTRSSDDFATIKPPTPVSVVTPTTTTKRKVRRTNGINKKFSTKTNENHKKCMIMGRIFKHVVKPKTPEVVHEKPDNLNENDVSLNKNANRIISPTNTSPEKPAITHTKTAKTPAPIKKNRKTKRGKNQEDSSDDEFSPKKVANKSNCKRKKPRQKPKVNVKEDSGINLEQEIRECIGVAGRKSQRKCTSGKQNVLAEFWSSDEELESELEEKIVLPTTMVESSTNINVSEPVMIIDKKIEDIHVEQIKEDEEKILPTFNNAKSMKRKGVKKNRKPKVETVAQETVIERGEEKETKLGVEEVGKTVGLAATRRKRSASEKLYYWSSSSDDETGDLIEVKPVRDDTMEDDRPLQHGWIVGDSPKKLVTMLAQAKGKKMVDSVSVKEQGRRNKLTS